MKTNGTLLTAVKSVIFLFILSCSVFSAANTNGIKTGIAKDNLPLPDAYTEVDSWCAVSPSEINQKLVNPITMDGKIVVIR